MIDYPQTMHRRFLHNRTLEIAESSVMESTGSKSNVLVVVGAVLLKLFSGTTCLTNAPHQPPDPGVNLASIEQWMRPDRATTSDEVYRSEKAGIKRHGNYYR